MCKICTRQTTDRQKERADISCANIDSKQELLYIHNYALLSGQIPTELFIFRETLCIIHECLKYNCTSQILVSYLTLSKISVI